MANEAVIIELANENPVQRTVAAGTTIEKGSLLKLTDENTAIISSGGGDVFGGIAAVEKSSTETTVVTLACHMNGVFDLTTHTAAAITIGEKVTISGENLIRLATEAEVNSGAWIGYAEGATARGTQEVVRVRLRGG